MADQDRPGREAGDDGGVAVDDVPGPAKALLRVAAVSDSPSFGEIMTAARVWAGAEIGPGDIDPAVSAMLVDVVGAEVRRR